MSEGNERRIAREIKAIIANQPLADSMVALAMVGGETLALNTRDWRDATDMFSKQVYFFAEGTWLLYAPSEGSA